MQNWVRPQKQSWIEWRNTATNRLRQADWYSNNSFPAMVQAWTHLPGNGWRLATSLSAHGAQHLRDKLICSVSSHSTHMRRLPKTLRACLSCCSLMTQEKYPQCPILPTWTPSCQGAKRVLPVLAVRSLGSKDRASLKACRSQNASVDLFKRAIKVLVTSSHDLPLRST